MVWAESLDRLKTIARESARQPGEAQPAALWLLRSQVVEWLASDPLRPACQALLRRAVASMADATTTPAVDATTRSAEIRSAVLALEDRVPLGITELRLCRKVLGFGSVSSCSMVQRSRRDSQSSSIASCPASATRLWTRALFPGCRRGSSS